ncbi:hypothetical protein, partial [Azospirillum sp. B21]|uniref:hypothetical protein n=1 Tax=Azospirillum sp. B21 TaxID=2607496 RepID=UPI001B3B93FC
FGNFLDRGEFPLYFNAIFQRHIRLLYFRAPPPPIESIRGSGSSLQGRTRRPPASRQTGGPALFPFDRSLDPMLDLLFLALTAGFFAAAVAYVHACDRL